MDTCVDTTCVDTCVDSYVAFLRGINVGGHNRLKMDDLRQAFAVWGFTNVKTVLASGNVVFDARETGPDALADTVSQGIKKTFGMDIGVLVRTLVQVRALVDQDPFKQVTVTPDTRLYVTFLPGDLPTGPGIPPESPEKEFRVLSVADGVVCSVLTVTPQKGTTSAMDLLENEFGRHITTRNWNTITRIAGSRGETK